MSRQVDREGRSARNRTARGVQARRREAMRSRNEEPEEEKEPQVELEGSAEQARNRIGEDRSVGTEPDRRVGSTKTDRPLEVYYPSLIDRRISRS